MVREYTEISHFRAPYKNWPHLGMGADAAPPALVVTEASGVRVLSPAAGILLANLLANSSTIFLDNDTAKLDVRLAVDPRPTGIQWMNDHLSQGKTIIIGAEGGIETVITALAAGQSVTMQNIGLIASTDEAKFAGPGSAFTAVLARPTKTPVIPGIKPASPGLFSSIGPAGTALIALAVIGGIVFLRKKSHRRVAISNKSRRRSKKNSEHPPFSVHVRSAGAISSKLGGVHKNLQSAINEAERAAARGADVWIRDGHGVDILRF